MAEGHCNLGVALQRADRLDEAAGSFRQAIAAKPDFVEAHWLLADILQRQGQLDPAIASYRRALELKPDNAAAYSRLAQALQQAERLEEAVESYRRALALNPDHADAHNNLGVALAEQGRWAGAAESHRRAIELDPDHAEAHSNLGSALISLGQPGAAIECLQRAIEVKPSLAGAYANLGAARVAQNRPGEAIEAYLRGLAHAPDDADLHTNLAFAQLATADFDSGWQEFEWRWRTRQLRPRRFAQPLWAGAEIGDRVVLLHAEQGFGDTIQFCRYAPLVAGKSRVILEVPRPLVRLLSSLEGISCIVAEGDPLPPFDLHCPLLSLPRAFGTSLATIPGEVPYLEADATQVTAWRDRLAELAGLRVGLAWAGGARASEPRLQAVARRRSIELNDFAALAGLVGVSFVSLQIGEAAAQTRSPPPGLRLYDRTGEIDDFADTAALIEALDLVISVDTAVAHLAGALGKPVWLLNRFDTDWRWLLEREDSPWYPTMRIFRQPAAGDWGAVIDRVADELARRAAAGSPSLRFPPSPPSAAGEGEGQSGGTLRRISIAASLARCRERRHRRSMPTGQRSRSNPKILQHI